jgi:hypothetical protein
MTALASQRSNQPEKWTRKQFILPATYVAFKGGAAALSLSGGAAPGKVIPAATATTLFFIGTFAENKAVSASDQLVDVDLGDEIEVRWYANGSSSIAATDVGAVCYFDDDQTVNKTSTGRSLAGRIWAVDSTKGVAVEKLTATQATAQSGSVADSSITPSYAAVDATNDVTITIAQGRKRKITLSGSGKNVTVSATGAVAGDVIHIVRAAIGASSGSNIINGGTGAGTLMAMTSNKIAGAILVFDGTDWFLAGNYQQP